MWNSSAGFQFFDIHNTETGFWFVVFDVIEQLLSMSKTPIERLKAGYSFLCTTEHGFWFFHSVNQLVFECTCFIWSLLGLHTGFGVNVVACSGGLLTQVVCQTSMFFVAEFLISTPNFCLLVPRFWNLKCCYIGLLTYTTYTEATFDILLSGFTLFVRAWQTWGTDRQSFSRRPRQTRWRQQLSTHFNVSIRQSRWTWFTEKNPAIVFGFS